MSDKKKIFVKPLVTECVVNGTRGGKPYSYTNYNPIVNIESITSIGKEDEDDSYNIEIITDGCRNLWYYSDKLIRDSDFEMLTEYLAKSENSKVINIEDLLKEI